MCVCMCVHVCACVCVCLCLCAGGSTFYVVRVRWLVVGVVVGRINPELAVRVAVAQLALAVGALQHHAAVDKNQPIRPAIVAFVRHSESCGTTGEPQSSGFYRKFAGADEPSLFGGPFGFFSTEELNGNRIVRLRIWHVCREDLEGGGVWKPEEFPGPARGLRGCAVRDIEHGARGSAHGEKRTEPHRRHSNARRMQATRQIRADKLKGRHGSARSKKQRTRREHTALCQRTAAFAVARSEPFIRINRR